MKEKVVIVGASGFIGSHVLEVFENNSAYEVISVKAPRVSTSIDTVKGLLDEAKKIMPDHQSFRHKIQEANIIINAAGLPAPDAGNYEEQLGANALLPAVIAESMDSQAKLIHISSVYVAGNTKKLTETSPRKPFSDYAQTKALGEEVLEALRDAKSLNICCVRATPLHAASKPGTQAFVKFAQGKFASVAGNGDAPCPIASVRSFALFIKEIADYSGTLPFILMQPWEGLTVSEALKISSGKDPIKVPAPLASSLVATGYKASPLLKNKLIAPVHKVSLIWQGQEIETPWADKNIKPVKSYIREELQAAQAGTMDQDTETAVVQAPKKAYDPVKRGIDIAVSGAALVATAPIQAFVAYKIAKNLGTPVVFKQERPGKNGEIFTIYKFKTMKDLDPSLNEWAKNNRLESDAMRLTPFGEKLRSTSLDELPNLWNVLKGDMSLIGPRPLLVSFLPRYSPEQARRHEVRPGITGLAQTAGRNSISWQEKFKYDVDYVDNRSPLLDLKILVNTVKSVFDKEGIEYDHGDFLGNDIEESKDAANIKENEEEENE
ncbi:MAG: sugar transferase [Micrococcaceae bacterium]